MIVYTPQLILSPSFWTGSDCMQVGGRKQKIGFPFFSGISPAVKFDFSPRNDMHISVIISSNVYFTWAWICRSVWINWVEYPVVIVHID